MKKRVKPILGERSSLEKEPIEGGQIYFCKENDTDGSLFLDYFDEQTAEATRIQIIDTTALHDIDAVVQEVIAALPAAEEVEV